MSVQVDNDTSLSLSVIRSIETQVTLSTQLLLALLILSHENKNFAKSIFRIFIKHSMHQLLFMFTFWIRILEFKIKIIDNIAGIEIVNPILICK